MSLTCSNRCQMRHLRTLAAATLCTWTSAFGMDFSDPDWKWRLPGDAGTALSFRSLDVDADGVLTRAEAERHPTVARHFALADYGSDGRLSALEFNNAALQLSERIERDKRPPRTPRAAAVTSQPREVT